MSDLLTYLNRALEEAEDEGLWHVVAKVNSAISMVGDPESEEPLRDFALGSCGCVDYHMADCPTVTG